MEWYRSDMTNILSRLYVANTPSEKGQSALLFAHFPSWATFLAGPISTEVDEWKMRMIRDI